MGPEICDRPAKRPSGSKALGVLPAARANAARGPLPARPHAEVGVGLREDDASSGLITKVRNGESPAWLSVDERDVDEDER